ncbi:alpha/beta hydrolase domain-containing protein [Nocardia aurantia]
MRGAGFARPAEPGVRRRVRSRGQWLAVTSVACALGLVVATGPARVTADPAGGPAVPVVTGPITGGTQGHPQMDVPFRVADEGYEEAEYFVSGTARSFCGGRAIGGVHDPAAT